MTTFPRWADDPSTFPDNGSSLPGQKARQAVDAALQPLADAPVDDELVADDPTTGEFDLEDRISLRRVAGLSTELEDVTEVEYRQLRLERVVLVGVWTAGTVDGRGELPRASWRRSPRRPAALVLDGVVQRRDKPDPATYIGSRQGPRAARTSSWRPAPTPSSATVSCQPRPAASTSRTSSRSRSSTGPP